MAVNCNGSLLESFEQAELDEEVLVELRPWCSLSEKRTGEAQPCVLKLRSGFCLVARLEEQCLSLLGETVQPLLQHLLDPVAPNPIQPDLGCFQAWGIHHLSGQPLPVPPHPQQEEFPPPIQSEGAFCQSRIPGCKLKSLMPLPWL